MDSLAEPYNWRGDRDGGRTRVCRGVAAWRVWRLPAAVLVFVVAVEAAAVGLLVVLGVDHLPTGVDVLRGGSIAACALVTTELSAQVERWRAERRGASPHRDLFGAWLIAAVLLCPPLVGAVLAGVLYAWTWLRVLRRTTVAAHRWVFSAAVAVTGTGLAALTCQALTPPGAGGAPAWLPSTAAITVAIAVNTGLVATVILVSNPHAGPLQAVGDPAGFAVEIASCSLGVLIAACHAVNPVLTAFAVPVVLALHQTLTLLTHARDQAHTDPKTGLANAGWWRELTERELVRSHRTGTPVAVLIADLDHFKHLNDTHGHPTGDRVLAAVAAALADHTRAIDIVGRYGGEEFVLTLPATDAAAALATAERLRAHLASLAMPDAVTVTASVGIAVHPDHGATLDTLLHAADTALYAAKRRGRNTVHLAPTPAHPARAARIGP